MHTSKYVSWSSLSPECSNFVSLTGWINGCICLICKSYRGDGKWQTAQLARAKLTKFLFLFTFLVIKFISQEEPSCCRVAVGGEEGYVYNSRYEGIYTHMFAASCCVLSGIVSEAGAAPRLCTLTNACAHAKITYTAKAWITSGQEIIFLVFYCWPVFSPSPLLSFFRSQASSDL